MRKSEIAYLERDQIIDFIKSNYGLVKDLRANQQIQFFKYRQTCELRELALCLCID